MPLEFTQNEVENSRFRSDLQTLYQEVGFDQAEVYRERTPEETKDLVRELFGFQLTTSGIRMFQCIWTGLMFSMNRENGASDTGKGSEPYP